MPPNQKVIQPGSWYMDAIRIMSKQRTLFQKNLAETHEIINVLQKELTKAGYAIQWCTVSTFLHRLKASMAKKKIPPCIETSEDRKAYDKVSTLLLKKCENVHQDILAIIARVPFISYDSLHQKMSKKGHRISLREVKTLRNTFVQMTRKGVHRIVLPPEARPIFRKFAKNYKLEQKKGIDDTSDVEIAEKAKAAKHPKKVIRRQQKKKIEKSVPLVKIPVEPEKKEDEMEILPFEIEDIRENLRDIAQLKTVGPYDLVDVIGSGTFGVVFHAKHKTSGARQALKIVQKLAEVTMEKKIMQKVNATEEKNKFLCVPSEFFHFDSNGDSLCVFVLDLLRFDLFHMLHVERKSFPVKTVNSVIAQISSAAAFLNKLNFIHADVKPENIMFARFESDKDSLMNVHVKLIDTNASECIVPGKSKLSICQSTRYRAPEVILDMPHDESIDSWSLGVIALEMIKRDFIFDVRYKLDDKAGAVEHIKRILHFVGLREIPQIMKQESNWSQMDFDLISSLPLPSQEILDKMLGIEHSSSSMIFKEIVGRLLCFQPMLRFTPAETETFLIDLISNV